MLPALFGQVVEGREHGLLVVANNATGSLATIEPRLHSHNVSSTNITCAYAGTHIHSSILAFLQRHETLAAAVILKN